MNEHAAFCLYLTSFQLLLYHLRTKGVLEFKKQQDVLLNQAKELA